MGRVLFFHVTVLFEESDGDQTKLSMHMLFPTKEERDRTVVKFGAVKGLKQTLGRLSDYLAAQSNKN